MLVKAKKSWLSDGRIVVEVRDLHQGIPRSPNIFGGVPTDPSGDALIKRAPASALLLHRETYPRGTPSEDIKQAMRTLRALCEIRIQNQLEST